MSVVQFRKAETSDPEWITAERLMAYHLLLTIQPEAKHSPLAWRTLTIHQIVMAMREMREPEKNAKGKGEALMLLAADAAQMKVEGYVW